MPIRQPRYSKKEFARRGEVYSNWLLLKLQKPAKTLTCSLFPVPGSLASITNLNVVQLKPCQQ
ncbi:hypothetical protein B1L04_22345 [Microcystis aeruginosa KW]|uniref:Uncharacterized protein n=1 Tax=Microcystis aeruginosa KW TaxID=1960155 RepID=A0A1V4BMY2_MICAE|nr:hypothetical protein [Microcystis aeruginosa]OPF15273.1 hypothetical protein B1L04_22345 [Microcystis aeruginosa KW]